LHILLAVIQEDLLHLQVLLLTFLLLLEVGVEVRYMAGVAVLVGIVSFPHKP
jgi:hypothetical protein